MISTMSYFNIFRHCGVSGGRSIGVACNWRIKVDVKRTSSLVSLFGKIRDMACDQGTK